MKVQFGCRLLALLLMAGAASFAALATTDQSGTTEDGDAKVHWEYRPLSAESADQGLGILDIEIADKDSRQPVRYQAKQLAAWLQPHRNALSDSEPACNDQVRMLTSQGVGQRAEVDLNGWRLLTLNTDRTLAFINPFVGINNAKLESIVTLPGDADHWVSEPRRLQLWVHTRDGEKGALVRIDTQRRTINLTLPTPPGPAALVLDGDGRHLWVISPDAQQIGVVDGNQAIMPLQSRAASGVAGAVPANGAGVFAWLNTEPAIQLWQTERAGSARMERQWRLPAFAVAARWSAQSQRLLVATAGGNLAWIDPAKPVTSPERTLHVGPPDTHISDFRLFDEGRRLLWLDTQAARAGAVDVASGRELLITSVVQGVDSFAFTDGFAYVHSNRNARATLLSLADIRSGRVQPVEITTGSPSPDPPPGDRVVADPGGSGVLIANPADGVVYQYAEGMMAPAGSYSNYRRSALGIMTLNSGLTEVAPGHFRAAIRNQRGGPHQLIVSGLEPRLAACAWLNLPAPPANVLASDDPPRVRASLAELLPAGELSRRVRVNLHREDPGEDAQPLSGVKDLTLLVFDRRTAWQGRFPMQEHGPGHYEATVQLPRAGRFDWLVSSTGQNLPFDAGRLGSHEVLSP